MHFVKVSSRRVALVPPNGARGTTSSWRNPRETPSFKWWVQAAKRTFAAAFRAKTLDHRHAVCTLHVAESSCVRTSLEDPLSPLLPGAHETRSANVWSSCVRNAEHEKPLRPARLGCVCRDDLLVSLFLSSASLTSIALSFGCARIRVCTVTTEDWNKRGFLFLGPAPRTLEFTSFCHFDSGITLGNIGEDLRRSFSRRMKSDSGVSQGILLLLDTEVCFRGFRFSYFVCNLFMNI